MKTLNTIALQKKQAEVHITSPLPETFQQKSLKVPDQASQLVEVVKLYRRQEQAYFEKIKRKEFAKDELHHMKKTQEKLDRMLSTIN